MNSRIKIEADGRTLRHEKARKLPARQRRALLQALALAAQADRILSRRNRAGLVLNSNR